MAAPKGNRFWEARTRHGREGTFKSGEELQAAIAEYFEWNDANPLWEAKLVSYQGESKVEQVPKQRAMTNSAMAYFLGVSVQTVYEWAKPGHDFSYIVTAAIDMIRRQKFEGAAAELFNPGIISRDLGLADRVENDHSSKDGSMSPARELTQEELDKELERRGLPKTILEE